MYSGIGQAFGDSLRRLVNEQDGRIGKTIVPFGDRSIPQGLGGDSGTRCNGLLNGAVDGSIGPWDVDNVTQISGASPLADPNDTTEIVQVYNLVGFFGSDNGVCKFSWCDDAKHFEFDIIACPTS